MEKIMQSKWLTVLGILILCLELAFIGCDSEGDSEGGSGGCNTEGANGDEFSQETLYNEPDVAVGAQGAAVDLQVETWIYTTGIYTPGGYTAGSVQGSPLIPILEQHGYIGIKVPHLFPTCTTRVLSPTAIFHYDTYPANPPTTTEQFTIPLESRGDLASTVESKYPSGQNAHWEVWWTQKGYKWPTPTVPFQNPGTRINYDFDFCGTPGWGEYLQYLLCIDDICAGPFQERIVSVYEGALVAFPPQAPWLYLHPTRAQVVTPGERFTKTHVLCNYDAITHTYSLDHSSSQNWGYDVYTREIILPGLGPAVPANVVQIGPDPTCKVVELAATTNETDTVDTVLITATSQMSSDVYAQTWNLVFTPWARLTIDWDAYLPAIMKSYTGATTTTVSAGQ